MTATLFIILAVICCAVSSLLTEGIKQWFKNKSEQNYSANLIALVNAAIVGCGGTAIAYVLLGIPFILPNILCLVLMCGVVWLGSMVGYDKVIQLIKQITETPIPKEENKEE